METRKFRMPDLIMKKRNGGELTPEEIDFFVRSVCDRNNIIQESQLGAMLMAIYFRSMSYEESYLFTRAMMNSGSQFDWTRFRGLMVDKHSTGGVGDKVSLPLAPALAACGLKVPMISGRGLDFTGGTLDKLESIPGFNANLSPQQIEQVVATVGCCIVAQTTELNPADKVIYATRDVTCTVDCAPLIAASIVSKKAIENLDALVLDVKVGRAAFMKTLDDAEVLADYMIQISRRLGIRSGVFLTKHDHPIGTTIGNQIEIEETIDCLHGEMSPDLEELVTNFGGYLLLKSKRASTIAEGAQMIGEKLRNGEALAKFEQMLVGQGMHASLAEQLCHKRNYSLVFAKRALYSTQIKASRAGYLRKIDALDLGTVCCQLGAGRAKAGDSISFEVGIRLLKTLGSRVDANEPLIEVFHNCERFPSSLEQKLSMAFEITDEPVGREKLIKRIIDFD